MNLEIQSLSISIGDAKIVRDIDMAASSGEFVGVLGPNGSGKTTMLKTIYRVLKPTQGKIFFDGENLDGMPYRKSAKRTGVVSQFAEVESDFTVGEIVLMGRTPHKTVFERDNENDYHIVCDSLDKVGMLSFAERKFSTLSGGEKQRVFLARAVAQQVDLLVLDEPTNHLDVKHQIQIMNLVRSLNISVVAALHDLSIACAYCDKLFILQGGIIRAYGNPREVITEKLIGEVFGIRCEILQGRNGDMCFRYYE